MAILYKRHEERSSKKKINSWKLHYMEGLGLTPKGIYLIFMYKDGKMG